MTRQYKKYTNVDVINAAKESLNITQIIRKIGLRPAGGTHKIIKNKIKELQIDISHFKKTTYLNNFGHKKPLSDYLKKNINVKSTHLKKRLIEENVLENKCLECGQLPFWNNKPLVLELDHIDGDIYNNELLNLRILCGHCHSQTSNFRRRKIILKPKRCDHCGKNVKKKFSSGLCSPCFNKSRDYSDTIRKVKNRPSKEQLLKEVKETNYCAVGRKYEVSDTCIRNWLK